MAKLVFQTVNNNNNNNNNNDKSITGCMTGWCVKSHELLFPFHFYRTVKDAGGRIALPKAIAQVVCKIWCPHNTLTVDNILSFATNFNHGGYGYQYSYTSDELII
jgi:hypothetical protein